MAANPLVDVLEEKKGRTMSESIIKLIRSMGYAELLKLHDKMQQAVAHREQEKLRQEEDQKLQEKAERWANWPMCTKCKTRRSLAEHSVCRSCFNENKKGAGR